MIFHFHSTNYFRGLWSTMTLCFQYIAIFKRCFCELLLAVSPSPLCCNMRDPLHCVRRKPWYLTTCNSSDHNDNVFGSTLVKRWTWCSWFWKACSVSMSQIIMLPSCNTLCKLSDVAWVVRSKQKRAPILDSQIIPMLTRFHDKMVKREFCWQICSAVNVVWCKVISVMVEGRQTLVQDLWD